MDASGIGQALVGAAQARITASHVGARGEGIGVAVPATSANLGPGYDSFGVALDIPLVAVVVPREERRIIARGLGGAELPSGEDNLVWQALRLWCQRTGTTPPDVSITVDSAIPLQRGLGSSSAAAVAGLLLGRALCGSGRAGGSGAGGVTSTLDLLAMATSLEGHPDNAAAALVGGLVACDGDGGYVRVTPTAGLRPVVLVPTQRQSTGEARSALPALVELGVAARNGALAATTFAALAGLVPLRAAHMVDALHEPHRLELMPTSSALIGALRAAGTPCALSGAGPSVLAVLPSHDDAALSALLEVVGAVTPADGEVEVVPTNWHLAGATVCPPGQTTGPPD